MKRFTNSQRAELIGLGFEVHSICGRGSRELRKLWPDEAWTGLERVIITPSGFYLVIIRNKKGKVRTQYIADFDKAIAHIKKYRKKFLDKPPS
jgi:hypothetical protein